MADNFYTNLDKEAGITYDVPSTMEPSGNFYEDLDREAVMPGVKRKTFKQAISHGLERVDVASLKALGGLAKLEAEIGGGYRTKLWKMAGLEKPGYSQRIDTALKEWSDATLAKVQDYYETHPEEAVQVDPDAGYWARLKDVVIHPEKLVQFTVESVPLILEGLIGTMIAGPVGGVLAMAQPIMGDAYADARAEGTAPLPAYAQSIFTGYGEAAIEEWTLGKKLGLAKGIRELVSKGGKKILWEGGKLFFRGTAEEGSQEFNRNFWQWVFTDRSQAWTENVAQSAAVGGPMELVMGGGFAGVGYAGTMVSRKDKLGRVSKLREQVEGDYSLTQQNKGEINKELDKVENDVGNGVYDKRQPPTEPEAPTEGKFNVVLYPFGGKEAQVIESFPDREIAEAYADAKRTSIDIERKGTYSVEEVAPEAITGVETPDQAIGKQYGLDPAETQTRLDNAEVRYQELKNKPVGKRWPAESRELDFLERNRANIKLLLSREVRPMEEKMSRKQSLFLGHEIPKLLGMNMIQRMDFIKNITNQTSMKPMTPAQREQVIVAFTKLANERGIDIEGIKSPPVRELTVKLEERKQKPALSNRDRRNMKKLRKIYYSMKSWGYLAFRHASRIKRYARSLDNYEDNGPFTRYIARPVKTGDTKSSVNFESVMNIATESYKDVGIDAGHTIRAPSTLYTKIEKEDIESFAKDHLPGFSKGDDDRQQEAGEKMENIDFEEFKKIKLRTARILEVEDHPNADKLYILTVDAGSLGKRKLVAGLRESYGKDELLGKDIVIVANLKPAKIRGVESQGMLLAASAEDGKAIILTPQKDCDPGAHIQ